MKLSVSIPDSDVEFLDDYAARRGYPSRSAVVQQALRMLRDDEGLADAYAAAYDEWAGSDDEADWDAVAGDGVAGAAR